MKTKLLTALLFAVLGVAIGATCMPKPAMYKDQTAAVSYSGSGTLAVAVHDMRSEVVTGSKGQDFEGIFRTDFGIPSPKVTASGSPLAVEMGRAATTSLQMRGFQASQVMVQPTDNFEVAKTNLQSTGADRAVLLVIKQWTYDGYSEYDLEFDLAINVLDKQGNVVASAATTGKENIGRQPWKGAKPAFAAKLGILLNDPQISAALSQAPVPGAAAPAAPAADAGAPPPPADAECVPPCRTGYRCLEGQCLPECNPPCPQGQICDKDTKCVPAPAAPPPPGQPVPTGEKKSAQGESCTKTADCEGELRCIFKICRKPR